MKGHALFQGEIIIKKGKFIDEILKIFFSRTTGRISTKLGTKYPWVIRTQVCSNEGPLFSQVSDVSHGHLVIYLFILLLGQKQNGEKTLNHFCFKILLARFQRLS